MQRLFPGLFDYAVGEREGIRRKPYPDSVNEVLRQFDVDRTQAVYVGDSEVDVQTAANAGMDVCMVGWGFRDEEFLRIMGLSLLYTAPKKHGNSLISNILIPRYEARRTAIHKAGGSWI